jgi:outer membrane receptor for ferrienterochelin and colicin
VDEYGNEDEIIVTGQRPRGSVVGDIPPERTLDARDIRATGATSITELLDALAPEIGSARGRGGESPVLLLDGQRISSFREMRDIPTEAIQRVEILPEEVALKYGYRADQRVVNIVLRQRFRSTTALISGNAATDGGYLGATGDLTRLMIQRNGRTTLNLHAEGNGLLTEAERDVDLSPTATTDDREFRSLIASRRQVRGSATVNRQILGNVSATLNAEVEHDQGRSLIGLGDTLLEPLARNTRTDSAHAGTTLNWDKHDWHFNVTGNADLARDLTLTDPDSVTLERDRARTTSLAGDLTATANGALFKLPAGNATATFTLGGNGQHLDNANRRLGVTADSSLGRTTGLAGFNLDLPVSRRGRAFS